MAPTFTNDAQAITYRKVADYLSGSDLFKGSLRAWIDEPRFTLLYGSTMVEVAVVAWEVHPWEASELALVKASSCVTVGSRVDLELMDYLLRENRRMRFGSFHLNEQDHIIFAESVLGGEEMSLRELQTCILAVVTIADTYDDIIRERFGGQRAGDRLLEGAKP